ncbi:MAG: glutamate-5-semialdehyde dehydrogenase [Clostridia bacterium]|nr:glutamate-5-semialdehyde dehydrogenase [Clostridia bacterium]
MNSTELILKNAKETVKLMAGVSDERLNEALLAMARAIDADTEVILEANARDIEAARGSISEVMIDRLRLTADRIHAMAEGIREVAKLPSPLGRCLRRVERPNGLVIEKVSVPMGVIAIIYESRPNVTSDAAALAIKSGNVAILRGGKEAYSSSYAITEAMRRGLRTVGMPENCVQLVSDTTRESASVLMKARGFVDLLIPRGGAGLIRACVENATVPCLETGTGICHIYVDRDADIEKALNIVENAKTSRPSVCNAAEVCLVHRDIAASFLPLLRERLVEKRSAASLTPVEMRCDGEALSIIGGVPMTDGDYDTEFLDYKLAVGVVGSVEEAVDHILAHSTHHSEAIVTESSASADYFTTGVDSAAVYVNASTRFTDGGEFGLGCEMGISTQKMHARGPLGIEELTTYKYIIRGEGQVR